MIQYDCYIGCVINIRVRSAVNFFAYLKESFLANKTNLNKKVDVNNKTNLLTIDDLAHKVEVPSRTIRYYTQEGLLPSPILRGRLGLYTEEHVKKLELIKKLQKQTYLPLSVIREIVNNPERAELLDENIKMKEEVFRSLGYDLDSFKFGLRELAHKVSLSLNQVKKLEEIGLIGPEHVTGAKKYDQHDVEIAKMAKRFIDAGFSIESLKCFNRLLEKLAHEERNLFYEKFQSEIEASPEKVIEKAREIITAANHLILILHAKLVQRKIEKEIFEYSHRNSSKTVKSTTS